MVSKRTIEKDTIWVVRLTCGVRLTGTYEEMKRWADTDDCKDFDICAKQPEHLQEFYDGYFKYCYENEFVFVNDYYNRMMLKKHVRCN